MGFPGRIFKLCLVRCLAVRWLRLAKDRSKESTANGEHALAIIRCVLELAALPQASSANALSMFSAMSILVAQSACASFAAHSAPGGTRPKKRVVKTL